jgi:hypothetical protein
MSNKQGRAVGGSCFGGVLGGTLGVILGGGIAYAWTVSKATGVGVVDAFVGFFFPLIVLFFAGIGGVIGAIGGAAIGAGAATRERGKKGDAARGSRKGNRPKRD